MRPLRCTIDASCVIALDHLDLLPKLSVLFDRVLLPKAVREELFKRRATKDRIQANLRDLAFLEACDRYDKAAVEVMLTYAKRGPTKDRGEAEAVGQAAAVGASVIVDEKSGRRLAELFGLECHGTLWVLKRLFDLELLGPAEVTKGLDRLLERGVRLPRAAVASLRGHVESGIQE